MRQSRQLEICVDSTDGLACAGQGGADRVELCAALGLGGLTPSAGLMSVAAGTGLPCHAMIRPAPGDFVLRPGTLDAMLGDIAAAQSFGLAGIVIGVLTPDGDLDLRAMSRLIAAAGDMQVTVHRAFDLCRDQFAALEQVIDLGVARVLTSGGAATALDGIERIAALCERADGRIEIMAGSGVDIGSAGCLLAAGVDALHGSCSVVDATQQDCTGIGIEARNVTCPDKVASLRKYCQEWRATA
ncbi:copper homeostasis protein CutC [Paracoccus sp. Z330]|uniref:PF03932 family protein CutC n=1 Tax=Paracoccus onchidii TaxID=3017813 RepID=A0ABT4ZFW8_9RHOB|nr:copper homeostasis protein CutC [Paracoccus onchidii]MDB6178270.1 copper homeostasis protein CutC [Paracoccus onchidii]